MPKSRRKATGRPVEPNCKPTTIPKLVEVAAKIDGLNRRNHAIHTRVGVINAEVQRLQHEFSNNELRKLELMREFDSAAK